MKKSYFTSLFFALFGGIFISLLLLGGKVEAAAPAWECAKSKDSVTLEGTCFFGETKENETYKYIDFVIKNEDVSKKFTALYYTDIEKKGITKVVLSEGLNEYTLQIPVLAKSYDLQVVSVSYVLDNGSEQTLKLEVIKETDAPVVSVSSIEDITVYNKNYKFTIDVADELANDTGIKSISYGISKVGENLNEDTLVQNEEVKASAEWLTRYTFDIEVGSSIDDDVNLWVVVEDFAGNKTIYTVNDIKVDTVAPVITADATHSNDIKEFHSIEISVQDSKSGVKEVKYGWKNNEQTWDEVVFNTIELTDGKATITTPSYNGEYTYKIIATDMLDNESTFESGKFEVESGSVAIVPTFIGNTSVPSSSFTANVKISQKDSASIEKLIMMWIPEGSAKPGNPVNVKDYKNSQEFVIVKGIENDIVFSTNEEMTGTYSLFMFVIYDEKNNTFTAYDSNTKLVIDTTKPNVYFTPAKVESYVKEANVTISLTDENEVVGALYYGWFEASKVVDPNEITNMATSGSAVSLAGVTGSYKLWVKAYDKAGNETVVSSEIYNLDNIIPTIELVEVIKEIYGRTSEVALKITEDESGIDTVKYAWGLVGGGVPTEAEYKSNNENKVYTDVAKDGKYRLYVIATDKVGNVANAVFDEEFLVDVIAPSIELPNGEGYYTMDVSLTTTEENLDSISVYNELTKKTSETKEKTVTLNENGYYIVTVTDTAGNKTSASLVVNKEKQIVLGEDKFNVKNQMLLPVLENEGRHYISLPKGNYHKGDVLVLTKSVNDLNERLDQKNNYIILEGAVIEILSRRSDTLTITDETFAKAGINSFENYGYVLVSTLTSSEANGLGINTTIIDSKVLALSAGLAGALSLIAIFFVIRSKKSIRL